MVISLYTSHDPASISFWIKGMIDGLDVYDKINREVKVVLCNRISRWALSL